MDLNHMLAQAGRFLDITLGNIITLVMIGATMLMAWQKLRDNLGALEARMAKVEKELNHMACSGVPAICAMHADRLDRIEEKLDAMVSIATDVSWIKNNLSHITQYVDDERRRRA